MIILRSPGHPAISEVKAWKEGCVHNCWLEAPRSKSRSFFFTSLVPRLLKWTDHSTTSVPSAFSAMTSGRCAWLVVALLFIAPADTCPSICRKPHKEFAR
ncbi:unnamed protein product [Lampetra fluviatilis]